MNYELFTPNKYSPTAQSHAVNFVVCCELVELKLTVKIRSNEMNK